LHLIDKSWAESQSAEYEKTLRDRPFNDRLIQRHDYAKELQRQGYSYDRAWELADAKYPQQPRE
jgi:hypothetical protein